MFHTIKDDWFSVSSPQNTVCVPPISMGFFRQIGKRRGPKDDTVQTREVEGQALPRPS